MKKLLIASLCATVLTGCFNTYHLEGVSSETPVNKLEVVKETVKSTFTSPQAYNPELDPEDMPETTIRFFDEDEECSPEAAEEEEQELQQEHKQKSMYAFGKKKESKKYTNAANGLVKIKGRDVTSWKGI